MQCYLPTTCIRRVDFISVKTCCLRATEGRHDTSSKAASREVEESCAVLQESIHSSQVYTMVDVLFISIGMVEESGGDEIATKEHVSFGSPRYLGAVLFLLPQSCSKPP